MLKKTLNKLLKVAAKSYLRKVSPYVIWITWSIGKTSARMIISHILEKSVVDLRVSTSPKNFNSDIGLSLSILWITSYTPSVLGSLKVLWQAFKEVVFSTPQDVLVLEYWIDAPGDMTELLDICVPHCAIFTWLDVVHASQFDSPDDILEEKSHLLISAKELVLYPSHASYLYTILEHIEVDVLSFWLSQSAEDDIWFDQYRLQQDSWGRVVSEFHIDQWRDDVLSIKSNLIWQISAGYTSLWVELAMILWQRLAKELQFPGIFEFVLQSWRFGIFEGIWWSVLIDSTYNAAPQSMKMTIQQVIELRNEIYPEYELIYCLGDMNELWDFSISAHQELASKISQSAERIFLIGSQTKYTQEELIKVWYSWTRVSHVENAQILWMSIKDMLLDWDQKYIILFKASQWDLYMEEAITYALLDTANETLLPRQEEWWKRKKREFFQRV